MIELKVIDPNGLKDKVTKALLQEGETLLTDDLDRVNNLVQRKLCIITSVEAQKANTNDAKVSFNEKEYNLDVVKEAFASIGITLAKNIGVSGVTKKIGELTEEQTQLLNDALNKE